ncbi:TetR/AcrR family transcriptional regulator [Paracidovorax valerianellae]|uniref:Transcriptional regulator, TetR family n=1 Tax=Paracidovorax valerianellae TaxID=187868 RepID=A0A1G6R1H3_9BURK|nr:TetR/AcrR family transcriptional regulator [Paracidovorax valerianellae]MDA8445139.1 TetR/AcrR family transcriptional regulator [Paracidovorax valerianellae]SDC98489.1 transcriptional regulator, TetR family [Paracidovorax valerianellae]
MIHRTLRRAVPSRTHAERSAATQQHLIATAIEVIQSRSFEAMSIHELARTAGMTSGAVQHHFESKAVLMMRVLSELIAAEDREGLLWPAASLPALQRAQHFVQSAWNLVYAQPRFMAAWNIYLGSRNQPEVVQHIAALRQTLNARMHAGFFEAFPELAGDPQREGFVGLVFSTLRGLGLLEMFRPADEAGLSQLDCLATLIAQRCECLGDAAPTASPTSPAARRSRIPTSQPPVQKEKARRA